MTKKEQIRQWINEGKSKNAIAKLLGLSDSKMNYLIDSYNLFITKRYGSGYEREKNKLMQDCIKHKVSYTEVYKFAQDNKIPLDYALKKYLGEKR